MDDLLGVLASYSLISLTGGTVGIHRLLQTVLRAQSVLRTTQPTPTEATTPLPARTALAWLWTAWPSGDPFLDVESWPAWRQLVPHVQALTGHLPEDYPDTDLAYLLGAAGVYLSVQGRHTEAAHLEQRALTIQFQRHLYRTIG